MTDLIADRWILDRPNSYIGRSVPRPNAPRLAEGRGTFVDDVELGKRAGHAMLLALFPFFAIAIPMTLAQPFDAGPLPPGGVPSGRDVWLEVFGPRLWAAIGGGTGAVIIILLALVSLVRFRRRHPPLVWGNLAIVAGTLAASGGGTLLALGLEWGFSASLLAAVTLIWLGFRIASGARAGKRSPETVSEPADPSV